MANKIRTGDLMDSMTVPKFDKHLKKAGGHIGWNIVEITIKMKIIVWKPLMIKILKIMLCKTEKNPIRTKQQNVEKKDAADYCILNFFSGEKSSSHE